MDCPYRSHELNPATFEVDHLFVFNLADLLITGDECRVGLESTGTERGRNSTTSSTNPRRQIKKHSNCVWKPHFLDCCCRPFSIGPRKTKSKQQKRSNQKLLGTDNATTQPQLEAALGSYGRASLERSIFRLYNLQYLRYSLLVHALSKMGCNPDLSRKDSVSHLYLPSPTLKLDQTFKFKLWKKSDSRNPPCMSADRYIVLAS
jgi:hypothetical protein